MSQLVTKPLLEFSSEDLAEDIEQLAAPPQKSIWRPYLRTCRRKVGLIAALTGLAALAGFMTTLQDPYTYGGNFYLLVEPISEVGKVTDPTALTRGGEGVTGLDYPTNLVFLNSPGIKLQIAKEVQPKMLTLSIPYIWRDLQDNLTVEQLGAAERAPTKIFAVSYSGTDPKLVQLVLEAAAKTYLKYSAEGRETSFKAGIKFINKQLPALQNRARLLASQQQKVRQQYDFIEPEGKAQALFDRVDQVAAQQSEIQRQLKELSTLYTTLSNQLKLTPDEALIASDLSQEPNRQSLLAQLQQIETQIALESTRFTPNNPTLQDLEDKRNNILTLLNQTTQEILRKRSTSITKNSPALTFQNSMRLGLIQQLIDTTNQIQLLEVRYRSLIPVRQSFAKQAQQFPQIIRQYNDLKNQIALNDQVLQRLSSERETLTVEAAQELPWQLISKPQIPLDSDGKPIATTPKRTKQVLAGAFWGLVLGMAIAILLEKRRDIFYSVDDVQDLLSIPFLAEVSLDDRPESSETPTESSVKTEVDEDRQFLFLKAFDSLYAKLSLIYTNPPVRSLVVGSVEPKDGQSTVALYLAKTAAATGKRVLLVDANLRKPQLHSWLNLPNQRGLSNLLANQLTPEQVIQPAPGVENLFVLTAGVSGANSPKRLWSTQMPHLMEQLEAQYDLVIYDPPHFLDSTDISYLTGHTDGLVLVVGVAKTRQSKVRKVVEEMDGFRLRRLGFVATSLNQKKSRTQTVLPEYSLVQLPAENL